MVLFVHLNDMDQSMFDFYTSHSYDESGYNGTDVKEIE